VLVTARRTTALDSGRTRARCTPRARFGRPGSRDGTPYSKKSDLKPWRKVMWCVGALTQEYRQRMYGLL
jgi:hypothetical protein